MKDFWFACGHHLLDRDEAGRLVVTDEYLKAYLVRPELTPPADACGAEKAIHGSLVAEPRRRVSAGEIAVIADADARENWNFMIGFRDYLLRHSTVEAAYLALIRQAPVPVPPIFLGQLVHVILRNALDGCDDPYVLRAAEIFFRPQRMTLHEGSLIAADDEVISGTGTTPASPLVSMLGIPAAADIDVLNDENAEQYWEHSDLFHTALDMTAGKRGLEAFAEVLARWVAHLLGIEVQIRPLVEMRDVNFTWYVGLDIDSTKIGDALWNGEELEESRRAQVVGLFELSFRDPDVTIERVGREPTYLILAMTPDKRIRMKPQNIITGLPVRHLETAA